MSNSEKFEQMVKKLTQKAVDTGAIRVYAIDMTENSNLQQLLNDTNRDFLKVANTADEAKALIAEVIQELDQRRIDEVEGEVQEVPDIALFLNQTDTDKEAEEISLIIDRSVDTISREGRARGVYSIVHKNKN